jgi:hypothetical protein
VHPQGCACQQAVEEGDARVHHRAVHAKVWLVHAQGCGCKKKKSFLDAENIRVRYAWDAYAQGCVSPGGRNGQERLTGCPATCTFSRWCICPTSRIACGAPLFYVQTPLHVGSVSDPALKPYTWPETNRMPSFAQPSSCKSTKKPSYVHCSAS